MELLPKMYGKIKILNSLLKSNALEQFKVLLEYGLKKKKKGFSGCGLQMGLDGFLVLEDRALMDFVNCRESAEA